MEQSVLEFMRQNAGKLAISEIQQIIALLEQHIGVGSGAGVNISGEALIVEALLKVCQGPLTLFDVGANKGQYCSMLAKSLEGKVDFRIHSFEPSKETFRVLQSQVGGLDKVTLNNLALAERKGVATLFMDQAHSGLASLSERRLDHFQIKHGAIKETVEVSTLDDYCQSNGVGKIDFLKIDVEGRELDTLKGGQGMLEREAIDMIQFEFGGCNIDTRTFFQDFFYFFKQYAFELYRVLPSGNLLPVSAYSEMDEKFRTTNYLATADRIEFARRLAEA